MQSWPHHLILWKKQKSNWSLHDCSGSLSRDGDFVVGYFLIRVKHPDSDDAENKHSEIQSFIDKSILGGTVCYFFCHMNDFVVGHNSMYKCINPTVQEESKTCCSSCICTPLSLWKHLSNEIVLTFDFSPVQGKSWVVFLHSDVRELQVSFFIHWAPSCCFALKRRQEIHSQGFVNFMLFSCSVQSHCLIWFFIRR